MATYIEVAQVLVRFKQRSEYHAILLTDEMARMFEVTGEEFDRDRFYELVGVSDYRKYPHTIN